MRNPSSSHHREDRIHPLKDDKILADWNGLMAAAMARAGRVLSEPKYVEAAGRSVDFVLETMRSDGGRLMHRSREGSVSVPAFLDDYVFLSWACLELHEAKLDPALLERAISLQTEAMERFWDRGRRGVSSSLPTMPSACWCVRRRSTTEPCPPETRSRWRISRASGASPVAASSTRRADAAADAFAGQVNRMPSAHTNLVAALQLSERSIARGRDRGR